MVEISAGSDVRFNGSSDAEGYIANERKIGNHPPGPMTALLHAWFGDAAWVAVWLFAIWLAVTLPLALILWRITRRGK